LGLALLIVTFSLRDVHFRETIRYSLQGIALYPVFICAILHPEWLPFRLLNLRFVKFIGVLSYSLYLVHHVVIFGVSQTFGTGLVVTAIISFAISFMIAWVIYLFVEKPCASLRRRISQRYLGRLKTVADAPVTAAT
jgi:peptidoglycan/LPS O-acetylase OafA/YrhL